MNLLETVAGAVAASGTSARSLGLVPTMGALHRGHLALVRRALAENQAVVVSIFVNPTQFGPEEDLQSYPRDLARDLSVLEGLGVDMAFVPSADEMYPAASDTWVSVDGISARLEGEHRPGHFRGVATVVAKLFNIFRPDRAYFGEKDAQQLAVVRRLAADLNTGVDVVSVPTVRDADGLALSSRNANLTPEQRRAAPVLYQGLTKAETLWREGERDAEVLWRAVRATLKGEALVDSVDYVSVADPDSMEGVSNVDGPALVLGAMRMGATRLIDNVALGSLEP